MNEFFAAATPLRSNARTREVAPFVVDYSGMNAALLYAETAFIPHYFLPKLSTRVAKCCRAAKMPVVNRRRLLQVDRHILGR